LVASIGGFSVDAEVWSICTFPERLLPRWKKSFDLQKIQAEVAPSYKHFSNCMFLAIVVPALPSPASSVEAVVNLASNSTNNSQ
jgi:hypothetical protein